MADSNPISLPLGVRLTEVAAWACSALDFDQGEAARSKMEATTPTAASKLRAWEKGFAVATHAKDGKVLYAKNIEPGWTMAQCLPGKNGKDCTFLKDRLKKPVAFPAHVLTFDCGQKATIPTLDPSTILETEVANACFPKDTTESRITKANRLRTAAAHTTDVPHEIAVNRDQRLVQTATHYTRGWSVLSCPDGDKACQSLQRLKAATLPEDTVTRPCPTEAKASKGPEKQIPYLPDPHPWEVEYNSKGGHNVIIDLDTIGVVRGERHERIRFLFVNGPECKGHQPDTNSDHYEQRCLNAEGGAEWGADQGREALVKILAEHHNEVYLAEHGHEGYGRLLATVFVKNADGTYLNVNEELMRQGWGMFYMIAPDDLMIAPELLPIHLEARRKHRGLYGAPADVKKYQGALYMPSYHPKASSTEQAQKPDAEYTRIFNIGLEPVDLKDYVIVDAKNGRQYPLPSMVLPVGFGVQIFPASGVTNDDVFRGPLVINLGLPQGVYWRNDSALLVQQKNGDILGPVITAISGSQGHKYLPPGF